jgi:hypothetical protein
MPRIVQSRAGCPRNGKVAVALMFLFALATSGAAQAANLSISFKTNCNSVSTWMVSYEVTGTALWDGQMYGSPSLGGYPASTRNLTACADNTRT